MERSKIQVLNSPDNVFKRL